MTAEVTVSRTALSAIQDIMKTDGNYGPYKVGIKNVDSVTLMGGETLLGEGLLMVTCYYDDQREGEYQTRYLVGSSLTGKALQLK